MECIRSLQDALELAKQIGFLWTCHLVAESLLHCTSVVAHSQVSSRRTGVSNICRSPRLQLAFEALTPMTLGVVLRIQVVSLLLRPERCAHLFQIRRLGGLFRDTHESTHMHHTTAFIKQNLWGRRFTPAVFACGPWFLLRRCQLVDL